MNNELYHHGVKGMRWGVRNAETVARYKRDRGNNGPQLNAHVKAHKKAKRKELINKATTPTVKQGKGKDNISPAEKVAKDTRNIANEAKNISDTLGKGRNRPTSDEAKRMSDVELRQAINRIRMEREYDSLTRKETKSGFEKASDILSIVGSTAAIAASAASIAVAVKTLMKEG